MFDCLRAVRQLQCATPSHFAFIEAARRGSFGYTTMQLCSPKPFDGVPPSNQFALLNRNNEDMQ
jgi:hypothetical protein